MSSEQLSRSSRREADKGLWLNVLLWHGWAEAAGGRARALGGALSLPSRARGEGPRCRPAPPPARPEPPARGGASAAPPPRGPAPRRDWRRGRWLGGVAADRGYLTRAPATGEVFFFFFFLRRRGCRRCLRGRPPPPPPPAPSFLPSVRPSFPPSLLPLAPPRPAPNERFPRWIYRQDLAPRSLPGGRAAPAPGRPPAPGQPAAHPGAEDAERARRPPPAPRVPAAAVLHARQPHRAGRQEEPAGAAGADVLADRQARPAALLQAQRRGRQRRAARPGQGARRPAGPGRGPGRRRRAQAAGRAARRQVQLQALLQGRRAPQGRRGARLRPRARARPRQGGLPRAQRRLPALPAARRLARRLAAARRRQGPRGQEGGRGGRQAQPRRGAGVGAQVRAARAGARRPCGPRVAVQAGPLRLPPAALRHRLPRLHRGRLRRLPVPVRARPGSYQARAGERPAAGRLGPAGQAAQLQPADRGLAALLHAGIMPGPLLLELPQRLAPGHQQLLQLRARPGQPEERLPAGVPHAPAALGAHHPVLQRHAQPARPPALHLRLHAPERPPAPHMQLGVGQRTLRQEVCHLGGTAHPPTDSHGSPRGGETLGWLPYLGPRLCRFLPPPPPACRPRESQHVTGISVFEESTHFGTEQIPPIRQKPLAHSRGSARALLASSWTLLFSICAVWPKTNFSFCAWISVTKAALSSPTQLLSLLRSRHLPRTVYLFTVC